MARVAFFTETLPPDPDPISDFSFELMRGLAEQQHELKIFSTYRPDRETPRLPARIEALYPFRTWSWFELPRVLPVLLQFQPEVLHVIQPRREALRGLTNAMTAVANLASLSPASPLLGRPSLVTSFYDLRESDWKTHRGIISMSSAITVSTQSQIDLMKTWLERLERKTKPILSLVPIPSAAHPEFEPESQERELTFGTNQLFPEGVANFIARYTDFIWVPGSVSSHLDVSTLFSTLSEVVSQVPNTGLVLGGDWGNIPAIERRQLMRFFDDRGVGSQVIMAGQLNAAAELALLKAAKAVFLASLAPESLHLARIERLALQTSSVLVMSSQQAEMDSLAWRDRESAFISGPSPSEWGLALYSALTDEAAAHTIRNRLPDFARSEAVDLPGNVMSRIYAQLLSVSL